MNEVTRTAPETIWLNVFTDYQDEETSFPADHEGVTWAESEVGDSDVKYIRADLATPAASPAAEDAPKPQAAQDARAAVNAVAWVDSRGVINRYPTSLEGLRPLVYGDAPAAQAPQTVFAAENRASCTLFATRELADKFVGGFPGSVAGGFSVAEVPVFGASKPPQQDKVDAISWVALDEQVPPDGAACLFYSDDLRNPVPMLLGCYINGYFSCAGYTMVNVTHWAPPPSSPVAARLSTQKEAPQ